MSPVDGLFFAYQSLRFRTKTHGDHQIRKTYQRLTSAQGIPSRQQIDCAHMRLMAGIILVFALHLGLRVPHGVSCCSAVPSLAFPSTLIYQPFPCLTFGAISQDNRKSEQERLSRPRSPSVKVHHAIFVPGSDPLNGRW
jgi:hypothetical protein